MLIFRQLFDPASSTYTYLLACGRTRDAVLIDPVFEQAQRDAALVRELGLKLVTTVETHVHADHVTGAWLLKQMLGSHIGVSRASGAQGADRFLDAGERVGFGARHLEVRATPGHTDGCVTFVLDDRSMAFTGDALLIRGTGRTDFQQGDARAMFHSVREQILSLPDDCLLYPAHDYRGLTVTSVAEERRYNPRLGAEIGEEDFIGYMNHLGLPHPKQMAVAVPANMQCGHPEHETIPASEPQWAPLTFTFAGIWQIEPQALSESNAAMQVIDVREPEEFTGPLGHIDGAKLIPLGEISARLSDIDREQPAVMVCRSGARSAQATVLLQRAGYTKVANMAGGMLRWRAEGHRVVADSTPPHLR